MTGVCGVVVATDDETGVNGAVAKTDGVGVVGTATGVGLLSTVGVVGRVGGS